MREVVYLGHDNLITLRLLDDSSGALANSELASILRMTLEFDNWSSVIDSEVDLEAFDWSTGEGLVDLKLGDLSIPEGMHKVALVLYDAEHDDGIRWEPSFQLQVKEF